MTKTTTAAERQRPAQRSAEEFDRLLNAEPIPVLEGCPPLPTKRQVLDAMTTGRELGAAFLDVLDHMHDCDRCRKYLMDARRGSGHYKPLSESRKRGGAMDLKGEW